MTLLIVAPTVQEGNQYANDNGLALQNPVYIAPGAVGSQFHGHRDATVVVVGRSRLPITMENSLSMIAQQRGTVVITIPEENPRSSRLALDTLSQMPPDAFLKAFLMRFGPGEHRVSLREEYVISIREAIEPPQFETAEEALEWLDAQSPSEQDRMARIKAAENAAWTGLAGPRRGHNLTR